MIYLNIIKRYSLAIYVNDNNITANKQLNICCII